VNYHNYTLDRFEGDYAIFLKHPAEIDQLLIHRTEIRVKLKQGDIVRIEDNGQTYKIEVLQHETMKQQQNIQQLMQKLRERK
jgi:hypothetical protein